MILTGNACREYIRDVCIFSLSLSCAHIYIIFILLLLPESSVPNDYVVLSQISGPRINTGTNIITLLIQAEYRKE